MISINNNKIANRFHHLVCQIPHCTMRYALHCEFSLFSPLTWADRHTHYSALSLYIEDHFYQTRSIVITTVYWIARIITGCIRCILAKLPPLPWHPGCLLSTRYSSRRSVPSTPPPLVMDKICNSSLKGLPDY